MEWSPEHTKSKKKKILGWEKCVEWATIYLRMEGQTIKLKWKGVYPESKFTCEERERTEG